MSENRIRLRDAAMAALKEICLEGPRPNAKEAARLLGQECAVEQFRTMLMARLRISERTLQLRRRALTGLGINSMPDIRVAKLDDVKELLAAVADQDDASASAA